MQCRRRFPYRRDMPLVTVKVEEEVFSASDKARLIEEITEVVLDVASGAVEIEGGLPDRTWVLVEEVHAADWGVGGRTVRAARRPGTEPERRGSR